jgi:hypothetical protein
MTTGATPVQLFSRALGHLRQARELVFSIIPAEDQHTPLTDGLSRRFQDVATDVRGYAEFLLGLHVNHQGVVEELDRADRNAQNRDTARAQNRGRSHLKPEQVRAIRRDHARGRLTTKQIGAKYHLSPGQVGLIVRRRCWAWVDDVADGQENGQGA